MSNKLNIITIDGPSGVGKSTISRRVAAVTGFTYLDTGAMYRGVALYLGEQGVDLKDNREIRKSLADLDLQLVAGEDENSDMGVLVNGRDVSAEVRTPEMAMVASAISAIPVVREILTELQRRCGETGRVVAEGRDTGTVVFPGAAYKFFLEARAEERARRRVAQLREKGSAADYTTILAMTLERDKNDSERDIAPLKQAPDALRIDSTDISIDEVLAIIMDTISTRPGS